MTRNQPQGRTSNVRNYSKRQRRRLRSVTMTESQADRLIARWQRENAALIRQMEHGEVPARSEPNPDLDWLTGKK